MIYTIYHVTFWLRESHNNGASPMKTAMTISILSKCHAMTSASYSTKYPTYQILFQSSLPFVNRLRVAYSPSSLRSFSAYNLHYTDHHGRRIAVLSMMDFQCRQNNGALTMKNPMSDSTLSTGLVPSSLYNTSWSIPSTTSLFDYESHTIWVRRRWKPRWHYQFFRNVIP